MPTNTRNAEQRMRLEEELSFRIAATGALGLINNRSFLERSRWNVDSAFELYTTEKMPSREVGSASQSESECRTIDTGVVAVKQSNSAKEVVDKENEIEEAKDDASNVVFVKLSTGKTLDFPICKPATLPPGLSADDCIRYTNASIAQKTSHICACILSAEGIHGAVRRGGDEDGILIAETMSAATPQIESGIPKGKSKKMATDGRKNDKPVPTAAKWRSTSNLNSFLDLQSDLKTSMGKLVLKNHKTASKARDDMLNVIGFRDGHKLLKNLTKDDTKTSDGSTHTGNLQDLQHPEGPNATPVEKLATKKGKEKTEHSGEEDSIASASSDAIASSDATEPAAPPLVTTAPQAITQTSAVQLLVQALEALQQPSAAVPASGTYYSIPMSAEDLGEWLEFKKQQQERRTDQ